MDKERITSDRFVLNIKMLASSSPCDKDITICEKKMFKRLKDIAAYTNLNYCQVVDIFNHRNNKFNGHTSCVPYIQITKLKQEFKEPKMTPDLT